MTNLIIGENGRWYNTRPECPHGTHCGYGSHWKCRCDPCIDAARIRRRENSTVHPVREWARKVGITIADSGGLPLEVVEQYERAIRG